MRLLDLFCGAGGAAAGYHRAGFTDIVGIDLDPQPHFPFTFVQADALEPPVDLSAFDLVHASPPCQGYTTMSNRWNDAKMSNPRLIVAVRDMLQRAGVPYVIENVTGARSELDDPLLLCGSMFGLAIHRHRLFETSPRLVMVPGCNHHDWPNTFGVYGERHDGRLLWTRADGTQLRAPRTLEEAQAAMEMPWGDWHGVKEAIPSAFTEWLGSRLLEQLGEVAA